MSHILGIFSKSIYVHVHVAVQHDVHVCIAHAVVTCVVGA